MKFGKTKFLGKSSRKLYTNHPHLTLHIFIKILELYVLGGDAAIDFLPISLNFLQRLYRTRLYTLPHDTYGPGTLDEEHIPWCKKRIFRVRVAGYYHPGLSVFGSQTTTYPT
jgi:hypothetical protein